MQFRQWASRALTNHLVQGYTLNQRRPVERGIEFEPAVSSAPNFMTCHLRWRTLKADRLSMKALRPEKWHKMSQHYSELSEALAVPRLMPRADCYALVQHTIANGR